MFHILKPIILGIFWLVVYVIAGIALALGVKLVYDRVKQGQHGKETENE